jgi:cobalt-zinc-cadmium efflux system outer membrane protein
MLAWSDRMRPTRKPYMNRFLVVTLALGWSAAVSAQTVITELAGAAQTCKSGPSAALARAQRLAGAAQVAASEVLPNPSLVAEHQRALSGVTDHQTIIGIAMPLSISGRRSLAQEAARAHAEQAAWSAEGTLFESALEFRRAYAAAVLDRARVAALSEQQAMLDALSVTIEALAKGGEAAQYDLLRQRVHARLHQRSVDAAAARARGSLAFIEAWLGHAIELADASVLELAGGPAADARSLDGSLARHPNLAALQAEQRASGLKARSAKRRWLPDLELFGGYRTITVEDATGHGLSLSLGVPLTFFDHGQGEVALADAAKARAAAEETQLERAYSARLQAAQAQLASLTKSLAELASIGADAASLLDKTKQLYTAGEATLTELLEAFRAAEETQLGVIELAEELVSVRIERMAAAGTQLDAALDKACGTQDRSKL